MGGSNGNGYGFEEPEEMFSNDAIERMRDFSPRYKGWGNENFTVVGGSQFRANPEYNGLIDRDVDNYMSVEQLRSSNPLKGVADILVSRDLWNKLNSDFLSKMEKFEAAEDHIPVNFRNPEGDGYVGFLRIEDGLGYDVVMETPAETYNTEESSFTGYPLPNSRSMV